MYTYIVHNASYLHTPLLEIAYKMDLFNCKQYSNIIFSNNKIHTHTHSYIREQFNQQNNQLIALLTFQFNKIICELSSCIVNRKALYM